MHVLAGKFFAARVLLKAAKPWQRQDNLCPNHPNASAHVADDEAKRFADALFVAVCFCRSVASAMALPYATTTRSRESVKTVAAAAIANTKAQAQVLRPPALHPVSSSLFLCATCPLSAVHDLSIMLIVACLR